MSALVQRLLAAVNDPEHINRLAAQAAARTDPWRWYCRICGAEGEDASRLVRNDQAYQHLKDCRTGEREQTGTAEAGRLLHIWGYGSPLVKP